MQLRYLRPTIMGSAFRSLPICVCSLVLARCAAHEASPPGAPPAAPSAPSSARPGGPPELVGIAQSLSQRWLDGLGARGLVLALHPSAPADGFTHCDRSDMQPCNPLPATQFEYEPPDNPAVRIFLSFAAPIALGSSLQELHAKGPRMDLNRVPTPGLEVRGWDIFPQTRESPFDRGIEITAYDGRRIALKVRTSFYSLCGQRRDCHPPADAPMPPECFFEIVRDIPLDLSVNAPISVP